MTVGQFRLFFINMIFFCILGGHGGHGGGHGGHSAPIKVIKVCPLQAI